MHSSTLRLTSEHDVNVGRMKGQPARSAAKQQGPGSAPAHHYRRRCRNLREHGFPRGTLLGRRRHEAGELQHLAAKALLPRRLPVGRLNRGRAACRRLARACRAPTLVLLVAAGLLLLLTRLLQALPMLLLLLLVLALL